MSVRRRSLLMSGSVAEAHWALLNELYISWYGNSGTFRTKTVPVAWLTFPTSSFVCRLMEPNTHV